MESIQTLIIWIASYFWLKMNPFGTVYGCPAFPKKSQEVILYYEFFIGSDFIVLEKILSERIPYPGNGHSWYDLVQASHDIVEWRPIVKVSYFIKIF